MICRLATPAARFASTRAAVERLPASACSLRQ